MYKTKNKNRQKLNGRPWLCTPYPRTGRLESLQSSHPHRSAHTGADGSLILERTHIYKLEACLPSVWEVRSSVFFEAERSFGVKVISRLTQPQNRQDEPNTPDYYRAHCLELPSSFYVRIFLHFILWVSLIQKLVLKKRKNRLKKLPDIIVITMWYSAVFCGTLRTSIGSSKFPLPSRSLMANEIGRAINFACERRRKCLQKDISPLKTQRVLHLFFSWKIPQFKSATSKGTFMP